jgi:Alpha-L-arabinofuranosidase B (ABFB) domain
MVVQRMLGRPEPCSCCASVCLSVCPSDRLSVCPSDRPTVCPSVRLSVCLRWVPNNLQVEGRAIALPAGAGLASLRVSGAGGLFLRHDRYHVFASALGDSGDAMDATFRVVEGLAGGGSSASLVSLEAAGMPGFYVGHDAGVRRRRTPPLPAACFVHLARCVVGRGGGRLGVAWW